MKTNKRNWRYWRNLGLFALLCSFIGFLFIQYIGIPYFLAYGLSHPQRQPVCCRTPADEGLAFEEVSLITEDDLTLHGWYIPATNGTAVILLHGLASNRGMMLDLGVMLAQHGYSTLLLDLRMHGESEGDVYPYGGPEIADVRAAVSFLQTRNDINPNRIGILGWSLGGQVALLSAAEIPAITAVIADGPGATDFQDWPSPTTLKEWLIVPFDFVFYQLIPWHTGVTEPIAIKEAMPNIAPRPVLLISSSVDSGSEQRRVAGFYDAAQEPKQHWHLTNVGHLGGWHTKPEAYENQVITFFNQALLD